jgi:teichuronic acid biosynthesis glycosyltransferase TuaC
LRVLIITRLFPSSLEPHLGAFNRQQFRALADLCAVEVLATIPWFPGARAAGRWSLAGRLGRVPRRERIDGLDVAHPRYAYVPRFYGLNGGLYAASLAREVLRRRGQFDVILGSWAYPDGVGAILLGRLVGVPAVVKVHGSDLNVVAGLPGPERNLRWALPRASRVVAVSRPLAERAVALGAARDRVDLVPNGVDTSLFHPRDPDEARARLGRSGDRRGWLLYVGRMERPKGIFDLLDAFGRLGRDDLRLVVVGDGSARAEWLAAAAPLGDRVLAPGARPLEEVPLWLASSRALVLPSWNEGAPNVVLEALACGRRVVATTVGALPELVTSEALGELVPPRAVEALSAALSRAADAPSDPDEIARLGARGTWDESALRLLDSLEAARRSR